MDNNTRKVNYMISVVMGTLDQVGDYELPNDQEFVAKGYSYTMDEIEEVEKKEKDPLKYAEKALFLAYFYARKLAEHR